jgi:hypothetical protein
MLHAPVWGNMESAQQELEQFKVEVGAPDGILSLSGRSHKGYYRGYRCPSFIAAESVVEAVRGAQVKQTSAAANTRSMKIYMQRNACKPAVGKYGLLAKGREVEINRGFEASENWVALEVSDPTGKRAGLLFDASPYAIRD